MDINNQNDLNIINNVDWKQYLNDYQDVKDAKIDPRIHYLLYGKNEGRKIKIKDDVLNKQFKNNENKGDSDGMHYEEKIFFDTNIQLEKNTEQSEINARPKISIIIPNYNNSAFLDKAISSLVNQTLKDIEIIIIDDCSTDNSVKIIEEFVRIDNRVKMIAFEKNKNRHMARKAGMELACGEYLMFLDPDDFFKIDACKIAYETAKKGYDIVYFNIAFITTDHKIITDNNYNLARDGEYSCKEMFDEYYITRKLRFSLCNKIFSATMCKKALTEIDDGHFPFAEDCYKITALSKDTKKFVKIPDVLYYYRVNYRIPYLDNKERVKKQYNDFWTLFPAYQAYCHKWGFDNYYKNFKKIMFKYNIINFLSCGNDICADEYLESAFRNYGFEEFINDINEISIESEYKLAKLLYKHPLAMLSANKYKSIQQDRSFLKLAVYVPQFNIELINSFIGDFSRYLYKYNYKLLLITSDKKFNNINIGPVEVATIKNCGMSREELPKYLYSLYNILKKERPDNFIFVSPESSILFWSTIICKYLGIAIIGIELQDFRNNISIQINHKLGKTYSHLQNLTILSTLDKLICSTKESEIYYRSNGINAEFIKIDLACNIPIYKNNQISNKQKDNLINDVTVSREEKNFINEEYFDDLLEIIIHNKTYSNFKPCSVQSLGNTIRKLDEMIN